ncbi:MAG: DUF4412 domain-containing protein [Chitinophagaceae bacterium]
MKKTGLFLFLLITLIGRAQVFQGTITWSVKYDITDPAKKAEMEKQKKQMNDPATQEKMKKMQEQMNSPEMKKMMEANPQMKERMDAAMKMMQGGNGGSLMPTNFIVKTNGINSITKMEGGMMAIEMLYLTDKKQVYMINRNAKTYSLLPSNSNTDHKGDSIQHKVTKTGETMKVLDYTCTKYIVEITTEHGSTMNQVFWTTNEIKGLDMKTMARQKMGNNGQSFYYEGISGMPLRMEMVTAQVNMVMQVTEIKKETLPDTDFTIPADFTGSKGVLDTPSRQ